MLSKEIKIIYLHHSTGNGVWKGNVEKMLSTLNRRNKTKYSIEKKAFPKGSPYGWKNYPFDYYNIWVKNAGPKKYMTEPTLELLTKEFDVIVFKHCFPVSAIKEDMDTSNIDSEIKTIGNYKLQYKALKNKLNEFPDTKFIIWTGAALTKNNTNEADARRAESFFQWVKDVWNVKNDNIFLWDFRELEVEGGLYLRDEYAVNPSNSHPNKEFNSKAARLFVNRLTDIIENNGANTNLKGDEK